MIGLDRKMYFAFGLDRLRLFLELDFLETHNLFKNTNLKNKSSVEVIAVFSRRLRMFKEIWYVIFAVWEKGEDHRIVPVPLYSHVFHRKLTLSD